MSKQSAWVEWLIKSVGDAYIFGARGQKCMPAYRRQVAASKPEWADQIAKYCPVLSGRQGGCSGCKYNGRASYDCRGLTAAAVKAVTGRSIMGTGATAQWNDESNWAAKGEIATMPQGVPVVLFRRSGSKMQHTSVALGDGTYIHAGGHSSGVTRPELKKGWTHWAIPIGIYTAEELQTILGGDYMSTQGTRRGDSGSEVKAMQQLLIKLGYDLGRWGADGKFGAATEKAVLDFQAANALPADGVWKSEDQAKADALSQLPTPIEIKFDSPQPVDVKALLADMDALLIRQSAIVNALKEII